MSDDHNPWFALNEDAGTLTTHCKCGDYIRVQFLPTPATQADLAHAYRRSTQHHDRHVDLLLAVAA